MPSLDLLFVDPSADFAALPEIVRVKQPKAVYTPSRLRYFQLKAALPDANVIPFDNINSAIDEDLYGYASAIATTLKKAIEKTGLVPFDPTLHRAFQVAVMDHLVTRIRRVEHVRHALGGIGSVHCLSSHKSDQMLLAACAEAYDGPPPTRDFCEFARSLLGPRIRILDLSKLAAVKYSHRRTIAFGGYVASSYRTTATAVIEGLLQKWNVVFLGVDVPPETALREAGFGEAIDRGRLMPIWQGSTVETDLTREHAQLVNRCGRSLAKTHTDFTDIEERYGPQARDIALQLTLPALRTCQLIGAQTRQIMTMCDAAVVSPGRPIIASLLVSAAQTLGKPTFEAQTGTIYKTRRFVSPLADTVFVSDRSSAQTYKWLGKSSRSLVQIGSIKLDWDLAPYRQMKPKQARRALSLKDAPSPLWMLATQPLPLHTLTQVTSVVCEAAARHDATLFIKQHPSETDAYCGTYLSQAEQHGTRLYVLPKDTRSALACVAADVVFTYYSTVGMEASALGKRTIAVNPFERPLPFDLAEAGFAVEAKSADDIDRIILEAPGKATAARRMRDGKAMERALRLIETALPEPRRGLLSGSIAHWFAHLSSTT